VDPIRVMVVDDSVVVRKIVTDVLSEDPAIEVVGTAVNGRTWVPQLSAHTGDGIGRLRRSAWRERPLSAEGPSNGAGRPVAC
jgi:hypothetical protein